MNKKLILLIIIAHLAVHKSIASSFYLTDTYGNEVQNIYSNTNNYLSLYKKNSNFLGVIELNFSQNVIYSYDKKINELKINPNHTRQIDLYIKTIDGIDTVCIKILEPLLLFDIKISDSLLQQDTLKLSHNRSIMLELYFEDSYKYITKFEDNVYIIAYVNYIKYTDKSCLIIKKIIL